MVDINGYRDFICFIHKNISLNESLSPFPVHHFRMILWRKDRQGNHWKTIYFKKPLFFEHWVSKMTIFLCLLLASLLLSILILLFCYYFFILVFFFFLFLCHHYHYCYCHFLNIKYFVGIEVHLFEVLSYKCPLPPILICRSRHKKN